MSVVVKSLTKIYGVQKAVNDISFDLKKGEIVGFLGPNGAGKSTTMKIITTYLPATSGSVSVCGYDVLEQPMEIKKRIGYLPESNPLYYDMYIREYLAFTAGIHKLGKDSRDRIEEMIRLTWLTKESGKKIGTLSKGYKQRVGLAQALLHDPEVLILDEPTSGLDPNQIVEIRDLIKSAAGNKTVLLSTHIMQEVQAMCSRVMIINNGVIVADDTIDNLKHSITRTDMLIVSFDGTVEEAMFSGFSNVNKVEKSGATEWKFYTESPDMLRREVMQWALTNNINISSISAHSESLEDVFRTLTNPAANAAGGGNTIQ